MGVGLDIEVVVWLRVTAANSRTHTKPTNLRKIPALSQTDTNPAIDIDIDAYTANRPYTTSVFSCAHLLFTTQMANFELQTRVPLLIHAPWVTKGGSTRAIVELVDMVTTQILLSTSLFFCIHTLCMTKLLWQAPNFMARTRTTFTPSLSSTT